LLAFNSGPQLCVHCPLSLCISEYEVRVVEGRKEKYETTKGNRNAEIRL
jgi:hypothetical protein